MKSTQPKMKQILVLVCIFSCHLAYAWGPIGHGAVGYIAEKNLTPKAQRFVFNIMGIEPFSTAAVFADEVRSEDAFKPFAPYHFLEIKEGTDFETTPIADRPPMSAHTIISQVPQRLVATDLSQAQKAVLLKYLIHIVGDVHQPLHIGNGVDMGANLCDVKWVDPQSGQTRTINLHSAWDDNLITNIGEDYKKSHGGKSYFGFRELAELAMADASGNLFEPDYATVAKNMDIYTWYREARALHSQVYPDATPVKDPASRPYCKTLDATTKKVVDGAYDMSKIPLLTDAYIQKSSVLIKHQILIAGYRLAAMINAIAESQSLDPMPQDGVKQMLNQIMLKEDASRQPQALTPSRHIDHLKVFR